MGGLRKILPGGIVAVLLGSLGFTQSFAADTVTRAELLASMCNTCHGTNGVGSAPIPRIAGQDPNYLVSVMKAFAERQQPSSVMDRHAQGYTEAELKMLAEFFSKQQ